MPTSFTTRRRRLASLLLGAGLACSPADDDDGGDGDPLGDSECELAIEITGVVEWSTPSGPACAIPFGGDEGIWMHYVFLTGPVDSVEIDVRDVTEGETGTFSAALLVHHGDGRSFGPADCSVTIDRHVAQPERDDEFARAYVVDATGSCTNDALDEETGAAVTVAPFELIFPAHWAN